MSALSSILPLPLQTVLLLVASDTFMTFAVRPPAQPGDRALLHQEVITLAVFAPFAVLFLKEPLKLDYLSIHLP